MWDGAQRKGVKCSGVYLYGSLCSAVLKVGEKEYSVKLVKRRGNGMGLSKRG